MRKIKQKKEKTHPGISQSRLPAQQGQIIKCLMFDWVDFLSCL